MMKIALIQLNIVVEAKQTNYERAESFITKAAQETCDVAVLPEVFNTGYSENITAIADEDGKLVRRTGVMGIVVKGGEVRPGDRIVLELPPEPHHPLEYVW